MKYFAAVDVAGGSGKDSYALCIGHVVTDDSGDRWIQDLLREWKPPFSPGEVTAEVCGILSVYSVTEVIGDRYAGGFPPEEFHKHGVRYVRAERDASAYYVDALALLNAKRVLLLDDAKLRRQLLALRREHSSGGQTKVRHPNNSHDDLANVTALAMVEALGLDPTKKRYRAMFSFGDPIPPSNSKTKMQEQLAALAKRTLAELEAEDERIRKINELYENQPMISAVWRVHSEQ